MRYHSTRSLDQQLTSREAVLQGLAADGGLFVTDELPELHIDPASLAGGYAGAARRVLGTLLPDFSAEEIAGAVEAAYGNTFADPAVTPVTKIGSMHLLSRSHGRLQGRSAPDAPSAHEPRFSRHRPPARDCHGNERRHRESRA